MSDLPTRKNLAALIMRMPYGELRDVAAALASMKDAEVRPKIETPQEYADMLWDWAESMRGE